MTVDLLLVIWARPLAGAAFDTFEICSRQKKPDVETFTKS